MSQTPGPLILGASGRIGQMWQALWRAGAWPRAQAPVWHGRARGDVVWDMAGPLPDDAPVARGVIVLAGCTQGSDAELAHNTTLALAGLDFARRHGLGPVILCSSSAVYGRGMGPQVEDQVQPVTAYGASKLAMEKAAAAQDVPFCALRIANVAGADMALLNAAKGPVALDQFADGDTPRRMYVGPATLLRIMLDLIELAQEGTALPQVLNVAQPGVISMGALLDAASVPWTPRPAPEAALPELALDLGRLSGLVKLSPATPATLVGEARLCGWRPAP